MQPYTKESRKPTKEELSNLKHTKCFAGMNTGRFTTLNLNFHKRRVYERNKMLRNVCGLHCGNN